MQGSFVAEDVFHGFIAVAPSKIHWGPCKQAPNGAACWILVAQAPGQKGAFVPDAYETQGVDTKPLTTGDPLPVWGTRQGIGLSQRGDLGLAPLGWFGQGLLTRPSSAADGLPVPDRRRVTRGPTVGRTAGSGDRRRTIQIRNESSRDQRAVKTNFAACHGETPRGELSMAIGRAHA